MGLKEQMATDSRAVFMDADDFAVEKIVNGVPMPVLWRDDDQVPESPAPLSGVVVEVVQAVIMLSDLGWRPVVGSVLSIDGVEYEVAKSSMADGVVKMLLTRNVG